MSEIIPPKEQRTALWWTFLVVTVVMFVSVFGSLALALYLAFIVGPTSRPDHAEYDILAWWISWALY